MFEREAAVLRTEIASKNEQLERQADVSTDFSSVWTQPDSQGNYSDVASGFVPKRPVPGSLPPLPLFSGEDNFELQFSLWEKDFRAEVLSAGVLKTEWSRYFRRCLISKALSAFHEFVSVDEGMPYELLTERFRRRFDNVGSPAEYQRECDRLQ